MIKLGNFLLAAVTTMILTAGCARTPQSKTAGSGSADIIIDGALTEEQSDPSSDTLNATSSRETRCSPSNDTVNSIDNLRRQHYAGDGSFEQTVKDIAGYIGADRCFYGKNLRGYGETTAEGLINDRNSDIKSTLVNLLKVLHI